MPLSSAANPILAEAETAAQSGKSFTELLPSLRRLSLEDFGLLFVGMPNTSYPGLSAVLPPMASEATQRAWTGATGEPLLARSVRFAHLLNGAAGSLRDKTILDFGCGYGRFIRLMYYFTDPSKIYGVDAWSSSLKFCQSAGLPGHFRQSDTIPSELPLDATEAIDVAFAFSIFTHLPGPTVSRILSAIRKHIRPQGLFAFTIRQIEFWRLHNRTAAHADEFEKQHRTFGHAFIPHPSGTTEYGQATFAVDYFKAVPGWQFLGQDDTFTHEHQTIVFLRPA